MEQVPTVYIVSKPQLWEIAPLMDLACTTCMGMCGNGVKTTGIAVTKEPLRMEVLGWKIMRMIIVLKSCCGVVPGAAIRGIAAPPPASALERVLGSAISASGWRARRRGHHPNSLLSLFPFRQVF